MEAVNPVESFQRPIALLKQVGPSCGTTSLAMALNAMDCWHEPVTPQFLDQGVRPAWCFTSPELVIHLARKFNLHAWAENSLSFSRIQEHLQAGRLLLALGVSQGKEPEPLKWHWQVIQGYEVSDKGQQSVLIADPNGWQKIIPWYAYQANFFKRLHFFGITSRSQQFAIVLATSKPDDSRFENFAFPKALQVVNFLGRVLQVFA